MFNQVKATYYNGKFQEFPINQNHYDVSNTACIRLFIDKTTKFIAIKFDPILENNALATTFERNLKKQYTGFDFQYCYSNKQVLQCGFYRV